MQVTRYMYFAICIMNTFMHERTLIHRSYYQFNSYSIIVFVHESVDSILSTCIYKAEEYCKQTDHVVNIYIKSV